MRRLGSGQGAEGVFPENEGKSKADECCDPAAIFLQKVGTLFFDGGAGLRSKNGQKERHDGRQERQEAEEGEGKNLHQGVAGPRDFMAHGEGQNRGFGMQSRGGQSNQERAGKVVSVNRRFRACVQRGKKGEKLGLQSGRGGFWFGVTVILSDEELPSAIEPDREKGRANARP